MYCCPQSARMVWLHFSVAIILIKWRNLSVGNPVTTVFPSFFLKTFPLRKNLGDGTSAGIFGHDGISPSNPGALFRGCSNFSSRCRPVCQELKSVSLWLRRIDGKLSPCSQPGTKMPYYTRTTGNYSEQYSTLHWTFSIFGKNWLQQKVQYSTREEKDIVEIRVTAVLTTTLLELLPI